MPTLSQNLNRSATAEILVRLFVMPIFVEKYSLATFGQRPDYAQWIVSENSKVKWSIKPTFK